jgi:hypothetical protein
LLGEFIRWRQRVHLMSGESTGVAVPRAAVTCSVAKAPQRDAFGIEVRVTMGGRCASRKELEPWRAELRGLAKAQTAMAANGGRGHGCGLSFRID